MFARVFLTAILLTWVLPLSLVSADEQTILFPSDTADHISNDSDVDHGLPVLDLSSLGDSTFTHFSHPAFPGRSARIKKSDFCDGGVNTYTGYIDVGARHLFFYFFESRSNPSEDDVLLWTNGGPGASSAMGLFMELGPCNVSSANSTAYNPHAWNSNANIFFIDQPVGVGFSNADFGEAVTTTEEAAKDIAAFVATFFETFDGYKGRPFHLTGESYGGRYLPVFAAAVYDQNADLRAKGLTPVNLKSVAIGNGVTDFFHVLRSYYDVQCTNASIEPYQTISACVRMRLALPRCERWTRQACIDHFDAMDCNAAFQFCSGELSGPYGADTRNMYDMTMRCQTNVDCYPEQDDMIEFLNQEWVRAELGVDTSVSNFTWLFYELNNAFWLSGDPLHHSQHYVAELLERGVRVLIYAGTYDMIANWVGNERWTLEMEWTGQAGYVSKPLVDWSVDGQVAGKVRSHGNLTFATVYGAGHLVPRDKPVEALAMIQRWLKAENL